jgi:hypothetical protein
MFEVILVDDGSGVASKLDVNFGCVKSTLTRSR